MSFPQELEGELTRQVESGATISSILAAFPGVGRAAILNKINDMCLTLAFSDTGLPCPVCGEEGHKVVDSRPSNLAIRRRRHCLSCGEMFTTYETLENIRETQKQVRRMKRLSRLMNGVAKALEEIYG